MPHEWHELLEKLEPKIESDPTGARRGGVREASLEQLPDAGRHHRALPPYGLASAGGSATCVRPSSGGPTLAMQGGGRSTDSTATVPSQSV